MDETTFQLWAEPPKTWQSLECRVDQPLNDKKMQSVTLFACINARWEKPFYMTGAATNISEFSRFLRELRAHIGSVDYKPYLLLDNHGAHTST